jgi:hypothetical protein
VEIDTLITSLGQIVFELLSFHHINMRIVVAMGGHLGFQVTVTLDSQATLLIQSVSLDLVGKDALNTPLGQIVFELLSFNLVNMRILAAILKNGHIRSLPRFRIFHLVEFYRHICMLLKSSFKLSLGKNVYGSVGQGQDYN